MRCIHTLLTIATLLLATAASTTTTTPAPAGLRFEANHGQCDGAVRFLARGHDHVVFLTSSGVTLKLAGGPSPAPLEVVRIDLVGADPAARVTGLDQLPGASHHLVGNEHIEGIAVVAGFGLTVAGWTHSTDFPVVGAFQSSRAGGSDAFVTRLSLTGDHIEYSTYIGGSRDEQVHGLAVDATGRAHVVGDTESSDFPTRSAAQGAHGGGRLDAFALVLTTSGNDLRYSTYLGGVHDDLAHAVAVDSTGAAWLTGETGSEDFPTVNPFQGSYVLGQDVFVVKVGSTGSLLYSTYLGGSSHDPGFGIAVDPSDRPVVCGATWSAGFPTAQPVQGEPAGNGDAFVARFSSSGQNLEYSSYYGGSSSDECMAIAGDAGGSLHLVGTTRSSDLPTVDPFQGAPGGDSDAFVATFDGSDLAFTSSSYLGGAGLDEGLAIAVDDLGSAVVTGKTRSADFPTLSPVLVR